MSQYIGYVGLEPQLFCKNFLRASFDSLVRVSFSGYSLFSKNGWNSWSTFFSSKSGSIK